MFNLNKKEFKKLDFTLILVVLALIISGLTVLASAANPQGISIRSQVVATIIGVLTFSIIYLIDFDIFKKLKWLIYAIAVGLLVATNLFGTGAEEWGANSWIRVGPVNFQPSEFVKVLLIIFLAAFIDSNKRRVNTFRFFVSYFVLAFIPVGLILMQPDLGTALVLVFIIGVMFFMSGINMKNIMIILAVLLVILILLGAVALPLVWDKLLPHQQNRILNFIDNDRELLSSGLQIERGYIAIGSGGLTGRGYKEGPMSQNSYIPLQHTDYIFPVAIEEFGFVGGFVIIGLFFLMLFRMTKIALKSPSVLSTTMVCGIIAFMFFHILENIGMTMRLLPVTGIPLPFFSYGGTFQLVMMVCVALVLTAGAHKKPLEF